MQKLLGALALAAATICASAAAAQPNPNACELATTATSEHRLLNAVALNGGAGARTFTVAGLDGFRTLSLDPQYTWANNGTLTFTCTGKSAASATSTPTPTPVDTTLTTCSTAAGTCTLNFGGVVVTPSLTANKNFTFQLGIAGQSSITCVVVHGGTPGAGDILTVTGRKCPK